MTVKRPAPVMGSVMQQRSAVQHGICSSTCLCILLFSLGILTWTQPSAAQFDTQKLTEFVELSGEVKSPQVTPDGTRVVFLANPTAPGVVELFSVPVGGGAVTRLNAPLTAGGDVTSFGFSPDGTQVLYLANGERYFNVDLYVVPVAGGAVTQLSSTLPGRCDVLDFSVSMDQQRVVYRTNRGGGECSPGDLYSVPLAGGVPTQINLAQSDIHVDLFAITPDSSRVVYRDGSPNEIRVYSVPIDGGTSARLDDPISSAWRFAITPDSGNVMLGHNGGDLTQAPIAGGGNTLLIDTDDTINDSMLLSSDGRYVVFVSDFFGSVEGVVSYDLQTSTLIDVSGSTEGVDKFELVPGANSVLFSAQFESPATVSQLRVAPLAGGSFTQLSEDFGDTPRIGDFRISPDGSRVLYTADVDAPDQIALFGVPIGGGMVERLSLSVLDGTGVTAFLFDDDLETVAYLLDQGDGEGTEAFSVPWAGGPSTQLNPPLVQGGEVRELLVASGEAFYTAEGDVQAVTEMYRAPVGGGAVSKLSSTPTGVAGAADDPVLSPDETRLVFSTVENQKRLYSVDLVDKGGPVQLDQIDDFDFGFKQETIDPTGQRVVYGIGSVFQGNSGDALFSVPLDGSSPPVRLSDPGHDRIGSLRITDDGQFVLYLAEQGSSADHLFSVPIAGGAIQQLDNGLDVSTYRLIGNDQVLVAGSELYITEVRDGTLLFLTPGDVNTFDVSPDEMRVAYGDSATRDLFTVPLTGGIPLDLGQDVDESVRYTSDGQHLVYRFSPGALNNLYSLPALGGQRVQLNDRSLHDGLVNQHIISPDSQHTIMLIEFSNQPYMLASAPVTGGPMAILEEVPSLTVDIGLDDYAITPDSSQVLFTSERVNFQGYRLYRVPIAGGSALRLDEMANVLDFVISDAGDRTYFRGQLPGSLNQSELRTVPIDEEAPSVRVHPPLEPNRGVSDYIVSADGQTVIYVSDHAVEGVGELYVARLNGLLFGDGFEAGDTSAWAQSIP